MRKDIRTVQKQLAFERARKQVIVDAANDLLDQLDTEDPDKTYASTERGTLSAHTGRDGGA